MYVFGDTVVGLTTKTEERILKILNRGRFDVNDDCTHITYSSQRIDHNDDYCTGVEIETIDLSIKHNKRRGLRVFVFYEVTYETENSCRYYYHVDDVETINSDLLHRVWEIIRYRDRDFLTAYKYY